MRHLYLFLLFISISLVGQVPAYYRDVNFSLGPAQIKLQLSSLVKKTHLHNLRYTPEVWEALSETDKDPYDRNKVILFYGYNDNDNRSKTDRTRRLSQKCNHAGSCKGQWNREHIYAKSLGTPNLGKEYAGADVHAIRACDSEMNAWRNNRVFADGKGNAHITPQGNFYPGDEWIGDVARMIMYMYLHYPKQCRPSNIVYEKKQSYVEMPELLLRWNAEDPPSILEIKRNNIIEQYFQGNRNPFIDNPFLATIIWGGKKAKNTWNNFRY